MSGAVVGIYLESSRVRILGYFYTVLVIDSPSFLASQTAVAHHHFTHRSGGRLMHHDAVFLPLYKLLFFTPNIHGLEVTKTVASEYPEYSS